MRTEDRNEALLRRIWDKENVVKTMNRHAYYYANECRGRELDELWVSQPENLATASLGYNNGHYIGMDAVRGHYVREREAQLCGRAWGMNGLASRHSATTPLVYIADDGRSARYLAYDIGFLADRQPDGEARAMHIFGRVFAELLREGEAWRIWHLVLEHDHTIPAGSDYQSVPIFRPPQDDPVTASFGAPPAAETVYDPVFGWEDMFEEMPRPYASCGERGVYTAGGILGKPYYRRIRLEEDEVRADED